MDKEEWKSSRGHYQVSSLGRVRSTQRTVLIRRGKSVFWCNKRGQILRPETLKKLHYQRVLLVLGSRSNAKHVLVHTLVAEAFIGPCPAGMEVNHKDNRRRNNKYTNLEYVSRRENIHHSLKGFRTLKLNERQVMAIRACKWGEVRPLSKKFGISFRYAHRVKCRSRYAWVH